MKVNQITIIGVGLIGGSLGLAIKKRGLANRIVGVTAHRNTLVKAVRRKAVDKGVSDIKASVAHSDLVIVATPVDKVVGTIERIVPCLKEGCIVTDVASVKKDIVGAAEKILGKRAYFVGAHPMAGSEQRGIDNAHADLFKGAPCIVTETKRTVVKALRFMEAFWRRVGMKVYVLTPSEHDRRISSVSHLPHITASALSLAVRPSSLIFAATGFEDTTRISAGNPDLWSSIFMANRSNLIKDVDIYISRLNELKGCIAGRRVPRLRRLLGRAKKRRDALFKK